MNLIRVKCLPRITLQRDEMFICLLSCGHSLYSANSSLSCCVSWSLNCWKVWQFWWYLAYRNIPCFLGQYTGHWHGQEIGSCRCLVREWLWKPDFVETSEMIYCFETNCHWRTPYGWNFSCRSGQKFRCSLVSNSVLHGHRLCLDSKNHWLDSSGFIAQNEIVCLNLLATGEILFLLLVQLDSWGVEHLISCFL